MSLIRTIDAMIEEGSLLKHPFYKAWSAGTLTQKSLAGYSKEYFQIVQKVPSFMDSIIELSPKGYKDELIRNKQEEAEHVDLWISFASGLGVSKSELLGHDGQPETQKAVSELDGLMGTFDGGACAMYSFEKEIPKISQTKLDGLAEFYGITSDEATKYFKIHKEADIRHAASWSRILEECDPGHDRMVKVAAKSVTAQNLLLDGCYKAYCQAA